MSLPMEEKKLYDRASGIRTIILLIITVFLAGGSWYTQETINRNQDEKLNNLKIELKSAQVESRKNREDLLVLMGKLDMTNHQLTIQNQRLKEIMEKL